MFKSAVCAVFTSILIVTISPVTASTIYTYSGVSYEDVLSFITKEPIPYTTDMSVTISVELAEPLGPNFSGNNIVPIAFAFNDGVDTITEVEAIGSGFIFSTDETGQIIGWDIFARKKPVPDAVINESHTIISQMDDFDEPQSLVDMGRMDFCTEARPEDVNMACPTGYFLGYREYSGAIGIPEWSISTIPIPAAAWLFGSGLLGLVGMARCKA